jgi:hypothetical protein
MNRFKNFYSKQFIEALKKINAPVLIVPKEEANTIVNQAVNRYTNDKEYLYPLWEWLATDDSYRYEEGWRWVSDFIKDKDMLFFFEPDKEEEMFELKNLKAIDTVIDDCTLFVFYITDRKGSFLLCYNDHDCLIACGESITWMREKIARRNTN